MTGKRKRSGPAKKRARPAPLGYFQARLLELLWQGGAPGDLRKALLADPKLTGFRAYIRRMDLRMIDVAMELVQKWGRGEKQA